VVLQVSFISRILPSRRVKRVSHPELRKHVSLKVQNMHSSGTLAIAEKAAKMRKKGIDVLSFSLGEPDFCTPENIIEAAKRAMDEGKTHYTPIYGIPELREAIAEKSRVDNKIPCESSDVMVTIAKQGIFSAIFSWVDRKEEVIIPSPAWVSYAPAVNLVGGVPVEVDMGTPFPKHRIYFDMVGKPDVIGNDHEDFTLTPEMINEKITPKTKMIILNSPSNPMGTVIPRKHLIGIAEIAQDYDLLVLSDEIYEKLIYDDAKHFSIASYGDMFERTITLNGFSKAYAMTGWRIGWVTAPQKILKEMAKVQQHTITCANSIAQWAGVEALTGPQDAVAKMLRTFDGRRKALVKGLNDIDGIRCSMPKGAFYTFFKYDFDMSSQEFAEYLMVNAHVGVTPGSAFGGAGEGYIRMSYAASMTNINTALERMKVAIEKLKSDGVPAAGSGARNGEKKNGGGGIIDFVKSAAHVANPVKQLNGLFGDRNHQD
jgi:aspartate aminotransferase